MPGWSPPTLSKKQITGIVLVIVTSIAYSVAIASQLLLALGPTILILLLYLLWRFIRAVEAIADASQRVADAKEVDKS